MNKEEENKICMSCAKCCKSYWIYTDIPEEIERFKTLNTEKIEIIEINPNLWKVMFHFWCKHLKKDNEGFYYCKIYNKIRPKYCPDYPRNFLNETQKEVLNFEMNFCPLLKKIKGEEDKKRK